VPAKFFQLAYTVGQQAIASALSSRAAGSTAGLRLSNPKVWLNIEHTQAIAQKTRNTWIKGDQRGAGNQLADQQKGSGPGGSSPVPHAAHSRS